jgi:Domain of unknown function (DUF4214)
MASTLRIRNLCALRQPIRCGVNIEQLEDRLLLATGLGVVAGLTDSPQALFTTGLYYDVLGRAPTPAEVSAWQAVLNSGTSPAQVAQDFVSSTEFVSDLINNDYLSFLKRAPSPPELGGWSRFMNGTGNELQLEALLLASPEYYQEQASNPTNWISSLYLNVLNRAPSTAEVTSWNQFLQNGGSRTAVHGACDQFRSLRP